MPVMPRIRNAQFEKTLPEKLRLSVDGGMFACVRCTWDEAEELAQLISAVTGRGCLVERVELTPADMAGLLEQLLSPDEMFRLYELVDEDGPAGPLHEALGEAAQRARPDKF